MSDIVKKMPCLGGYGVTGGLCLHSQQFSLDGLKRLQSDSYVFSASQVLTVHFLAALMSPFLVI